MLISLQESIAKYSGLATVAIEWSALIIYYLKKPLYFGGKYPISYFATIPETKWVFSVCYVLAAFCFWIFARHHLTKYYRVPLKIFGISMILFVGTGLFPYDSSDTTSVIIHSGMALTSGFLFLAGMYLLAKHAQDRMLFKVTLIAIVLSLGLTIALLLSSAESDLIFTFEAGSWLVLQLWMVWISFYSHKSKVLI